MATLTEQLRQASRKVHSASDALVNAKLVALFVDRELYARALALFYFVFAALEAQLSKALDSVPGGLGRCSWSGGGSGKGPETARCSPTAPRLRPARSARQS